MLGVDVSKASLECALLDRTTEEYTWEKTFTNDVKGVERLLAATPPDVPWVLEPTGRYSLAVVRQARAAGRRVLLAPPRKAKSYLASVSPRAKTDRIDGRGLAWFAVTRPKHQALTEYPVNPEPVEKVEQLQTARKGVVQALMSLRQRLAELPYAAAPLEAAIAGLETQRAALDEQIAAAAQAVAPADVKRLKAVVGVGPVTANAVAARLAARNFPQGDQFVAYVGLDIATFESGKRKGERGLTKQGDAELRRLFFMCAKSAVRSEKGPFRAHYERELAKGRKKTAALCIVARKIAKLCWSLVTHGDDYRAERVYQPADPKRKGAELPTRPLEEHTAAE